MKRQLIWMSAILVAASLGGPVFAQGPKHEKMGGMMEHRPEMMQMHEKMEAQWKSEDAELDNLMTQMNTATGNEKINAMAALIDKLVELHKKHHEEMSEMHDSMMKSHMKMKGPIGMSPTPSAQPMTP